MLVSDKKLACIEVVMYTRINGQRIVARAVVFHDKNPYGCRIYHYYQWTEQQIYVALAQNCLAVSAQYV